MKKIPPIFKKPDAIGVNVSGTESVRRPKASEGYLRELRHRFYDWLEQVGTPCMGVGQPNRGHAHDFLEDYAKAKSAEYLGQLRIATEKLERINKDRRDRLALKKGRLSKRV